MNIVPLGNGGGAFLPFFDHSFGSLSVILLEREVGGWASTPEGFTVRRLGVTGSFTSTL